jgi:hypothetical protein
MEQRASNHPDAQRSLDAVLRSFRRPSARGFRRSILSGIREVECFTPAGLYVGRAPAFDVDHQRLDRVTERITRGLFLHHVGRRLPVDCGVAAFTVRGLSLADSEVRSSFLSALDAVSVNALHSVGDDVFNYRYAIAGDQENSSMWIFIVYQAIAFISSTLDLSGDPSEDGAKKQSP